MSESSVSEHGFDLRDAEHQDWTNRYVFRYPETWASQMMDSSLTVGLRSIILKPDPVEISLSGLQVAYVNDQPLATCLAIDENAGYARPSINAQTLFPDRFPIYVDMEINEGVKMGDVADALKTATNDEIMRYSSCYDEFKEIFDSSYPMVLEDFMINYKCVNYAYTKDRLFIMETINPDQVKFLTVYSVDKKAQASPPSDMSPTDPAEKPTTSSSTIPTCFTEDFENLLNVRISRTGVINNLNELLVCLAGLNKNIPPAQARSIGEQLGITFEGVQTISYSIDPEYGPGEGGTYNLDDPVSVRYAHCILFTGLVVSNVWSRKDVLLRSSIAELDVRNYLGYSTMTTSSPVCIYAQPKMYPIESQSYKFWVDVYDSFNEEPIELPENVILIIEAALHINPKIQFNRY